MTGMVIPNALVPLKAWPQAFPLSSLTSGSQPVAGDTLVTGWALYETTGADLASCNIIDGNDANGTIVARVNLLAGQSVRDMTGILGLLFTVGVYVQVLSGSIAGTIWGMDV